MKGGSRINWFTVAEQQGCEKSVRKRPPCDKSAAIIDVQVRVHSSLSHSQYTGVDKLCASYCTLWIYQTQYTQWILQSAVSKRMYTVHWSLVKRKNKKENEKDIMAQSLSILLCNDHNSLFLPWQVRGRAKSNSCNESETWVKLITERKTESC